MEKIKYKKKYGQNFLYDENILTKIKKSAAITDKDLIIEIGPGSGNLTKILKECSTQTDVENDDEEKNQEDNKFFNYNLENDEERENSSYSSKEDIINMLES